MRLLIVTSLALLMFASRSAFAAEPPCSCIQELWVDYPGPDDLYICLTKYTSCDDVGEEELWYGFPSSSFPQHCEDNNCETAQDENRRSAAIMFPGHSQSFVGTVAWDVIRTGLESAKRRTPELEYGAPRYHRIPHAKLPQELATAGDMIVMAVPISVNVKKSRLDGKTYYLCIQIDSAKGVPIADATVEECKLGSGSQMQVNYRVNGEVRKGLVWLKQ